MNREQMVLLRYSSIGMSLTASQVVHAEAPLGENVPGAHVVGIGELTMQ